MKATLGQLCGLYIQCPLLADGEKKAEVENGLVSFHRSRSSSPDCSNVESRVLNSYFYSKKKLVPTSEPFTVRWSQSLLTPGSPLMYQSEHWHDRAGLSSSAHPQRLAGLGLVAHLVSSIWKGSRGIKWDHGYGTLNRMSGIWRRSSQY